MAIATVLLVDDDPDVRKVAALSLARLRPWRVIEAGSAKDGLALAERERPDLVLLDVSMPGMDGLSLFRAIRGLEGMNETPVIFVTAHAMPTHTTRLATLGASGVITKPFVAKNLPAQIEAILAGSPSPTAPKAPPSGDESSAAEGEVLRALAAARAGFVVELPGKLDALDATLARLRATVTDADALEEARARAHKLAGSAGTHGLVEVSAAARRIEDILLGLRARGNALDDLTLQELTAAVAAARARIH